MQPIHKRAKMDTIGIRGIRSTLLMEQNVIVSAARGGRDAMARAWKFSGTA